MRNTNFATQLGCRTVGRSFIQELIAPGDAYLPGKGVEGLLPEIDIPEVSSMKGLTSLDFWVRSGFWTSLPVDISKWLGWMDLLADVAGQPGVDKRGVFEAAKTLYKKFLQRNFEDAFWNYRRRVPCFVGGEFFEDVSFVPVISTRWLHDPVFDVAEIRKRRLLHGYRLFILFLTQAGDPHERLGVRRLSDEVTLSPAFEEVDEEGTRGIVRRYRLLFGVQNSTPRIASSENVTQVAPLAVTIRR